MSSESIKTIFLVITVIVLFYDLLFLRWIYNTDRLFILSSLIITYILLFIVVVKLHHFLRYEFNISNPVTYFISSIPFIFHSYKFRKIILISNDFLFLLSLGFFGIAILLDLLTDGMIISFSNSELFEEISRILGTLFWLLYYTIYSFKLRKFK